MAVCVGGAVALVVLSFDAIFMARYVTHPSMVPRFPYRHTHNTAKFTTKLSSALATSSLFPLNFAHPTAAKPRTAPPTPLHLFDPTLQFAHGTSHVCDGLLSTSLPRPPPSRSRSPPTLAGQGRQVLGRSCPALERHDQRAHEPRAETGLLLGRRRGRWRRWRGVPKRRSGGGKCPGRRPW